ncbi:hypothetical protein SNOG_08986 [Parastagonospora nodorum SN15]|uniref:Uncharacterized protein n=1 Tax=Phaeosphaeria nodorum (strain SN15 / ATCC MYA-4574 / FGSC 10173) TaxID=321614 RepID=Q0UGX8_PHANO|nr:hypothetical protein SNOG_08986 [Parastagonospora nodorum SN15]EAT83178.1 hypothetical protein SNOG_08986 [Parastagonospora nodorum SN15]
MSHLLCHMPGIAPHCAAPITDELVGYPDTTADPTLPYVLVHSHSQKNLDRTGEIAQQARTEFMSATYAQIHVFLQRICEDKETARRIPSSFFMVLDDKSKEDRHVVLILYMSKPGDEGDEFLQNTTRENLD